MTLPDTPSAISAGAIRSAAIGHPAYTQTLPCTGESARRARLLVGAACAAWHLPHVADAAALVVSELLANAVRYSGGRVVRVIVSRPQRGVVRVAVTDTCRALPVPRAAEDGDEGGRGLTLVEAVSLRWGVDPLPRGKRVWAEVGG